MIKSRYYGYGCDMQMHLNHVQWLNYVITFLYFFFQSGCCKPPAYCGFIMKNGTFWEEPKKGPAVNNSDCNTWNNREDKLCYDCNSCKGGVLANIRNQWRRLTVFNACVLLVVTAIYALGCYAIKNNRFDSQCNHPKTPSPWFLYCSCVHHMEN